MGRETRPKPCFVREQEWAEVVRGEVSDREGFEVDFRSRIAEAATYLIVDVGYCKMDYQGVDCCKVEVAFYKLAQMETVEVWVDMMTRSSSPYRVAG